MSSAKLGHNRPPLPTGAEVASRLALDHRELVSRRDEILAAGNRYQARYGDGIHDDEVAGKAVDFVASRGSVCQKFLTSVEAMHRDEKAPWLEGGAACDTFRKTLAEPVTKLRLHIQAQLTD